MTTRLSTAEVCWRHARPQSDRAGLRQTQDPAAQGRGANDRRRARPHRCAHRHLLSQRVRQLLPQQRICFNLNRKDSRSYFRPLTTNVPPVEALRRKTSRSADWDNLRPLQAGGKVCQNKGSARFTIACSLTDFADDFEHETEPNSVRSSRGRSPRGSRTDHRGQASKLIVRSKTVWCLAVGNCIDLGALAAYATRKTIGSHSGGDRAGHERIAFVRHVSVHVFVRAQPSV